MNEPTCANCVHFRRHYIRFDEFRFTEIPCGHCVHPQLKHRRPDTPPALTSCQKNRPPGMVPTVVALHRLN